MDFPSFLTEIPGDFSYFEAPLHSQPIFFKKLQCFGLRFSLAVSRSMRIGHTRLTLPRLYHNLN